MFNPHNFWLGQTYVKIGGCDERVIHSQEYSLTLRLANFGNFIRLNYPVAILPFKAPGQISEKKIIKYIESQITELFVKIIQTNYV